MENKNLELSATRASGDQRVLEERIKALEKEAEKDRERALKAEKEAEKERAKAEEKSHQAATVPPWWVGGYGAWDPFWGALPMVHTFPFPAQATVLQPRFFFLIQAWVPSPNNWILRYRTSRNGASNHTFHQLCNGAGRTVSIIKSSNGYFFGVYNPHSWTNSNSGWKSGAGSFLFTLTNPHAIPPTLLPWKQNYGAYDCNSYGPTFGNGHDIHVNLDSSLCTTSSFPSSYTDSTSIGANLFAGSGSFSIADVEVYSM